MARIEWRKTDCDERTFQACMARLDAYWKRNRLSQCSSISSVPGVRDGRVPLISRATDLLHPSGCTRMGLGPAESVVGPDLCTHHVRESQRRQRLSFSVRRQRQSNLYDYPISARAADAITKRLS